MNVILNCSNTYLTNWTPDLINQAYKIYSKDIVMKFMPPQRGYDKIEYNNFQKNLKSTYSEYGFSFWGLLKKKHLKL